MWARRQQQGLRGARKLAAVVHKLQQRAGRAPAPRAAAENVQHRLAFPAAAPRLLVIRWKAIAAPTAAGSAAAELPLEGLPSSRAWWRPVYRKGQSDLM